MYTLTFKDPLTKKFSARNFDYLEEVSQYIEYLEDTLNVQYYSLTYLKV